MSRAARVDVDQHQGVRQSVAGLVTGRRRWQTRRRSAGRARTGQRRHPWRVLTRSRRGLGSGLVAPRAICGHTTACRGLLAGPPASTRVSTLGSQWWTHAVEGCDPRWRRDRRPTSSSASRIVRTQRRVNIRGQTPPSRASRFDPTPSLGAQLTWQPCASSPARLGPARGTGEPATRVSAIAKPPQVTLRSAETCAVKPPVLYRFVGDWPSCVWQEPANRQQWTHGNTRSMVGEAGNIHRRRFSMTSDGSLRTPLTRRFGGSLMDPG